MQTYTYYSSTERCEDEQQVDDTIIAWFTDVDLWEGGAPLVFTRSPEGLSGTIVEFKLNGPIPDCLWSGKYNGWYITPKAWNRVYSYMVEETEIVE
jgi:hypothetical protein